MALYDSLPGVELTVKDGNLVLPAENTGTQKVLIISPVTESGRAVLATTNCNPRLIGSQEDFTKYDLGVFDKTNPMARAWMQVYDAGCRSIYLLEVRGTTAEQRYAQLHTIYSVLEDNFTTDIIYLAQVKADDAVTTASVELVSPREDYASAVETAKQTVVETYDTADGTELEIASPCLTSTLEVSKVKTRTDVALVLVQGQTVEFAITDDGVVADTMAIDVDAVAVTTGWTYDATANKIVFDVAPSGAVTASYSYATTLVNGTDYTLDADSRVIVLTVAAGASETISVEYSTYDYDFASQLAGFCQVVSTKNSQLIGIMALKAPASKDLATIKTYIDAQVNQKFNQYLQVVGGIPMFFSINNEPYEDNFAGAYAGLVSTLQSYSSPTNKVVPGALFPSFSLSPTQVKNLINKHIVVPRTRNGRIVVADAVTTAGDSSDFVRLSTVRIVNDAVNLIREICEPYIGEGNTLARRNSLNSAINNALKAMVTRGALNDYRFTISASLADQLDGSMRISLDLVPVFETRRIFVTVALKPSL